MIINTINLKRLDEHSDKLMKISNDIRALKESMYGAQSDSEMRAIEKSIKRLQKRQRVMTGIADGDIQNVASLTKMFAHLIKECSN